MKSQVQTQYYPTERNRTSNANEVKATKPTTSDGKSQITNVDVTKKAKEPAATERRPLNTKSLAAKQPQEYQRPSEIVEEAQYE